MGPRDIYWCSKTSDKESLRSHHFLLHHFHHPSHLPDQQFVGDEQVRLVGQDHVTTVVPGLFGLSSLTPCCSSQGLSFSTSGWLASLYSATLRFTSWMLGSRADWHGGRQPWSTFDFEVGFLSSPTILCSCLTRKHSLKIHSCLHTPGIWAVLAVSSPEALPCSRHKVAWKPSGILFQFFSVAPPFPCFWRNWNSPLHWRHSSQEGWCNSLLQVAQLDERSW